MIRILATTAIAAACMTAVLSTTATATAAPRGAVWYECVGGWQPNQCVKSGMTPNTARARQIVFIPPPPPKKPDPDPKVPRFEIHPEGNGAVSGGGGAGGGGGGGGR